MTIATEPKKWIRPLGESADINEISDDYQGENSISFKDLFPPITQLPLSAGGICPDRKDTNALYKLLGDYIWYAQHGGVPTYSTEFDYHAGALVSYNNKCYIALTNNGASSTIATPDDDTVWTKIPSMNEVAQDAVTITGAQTITGAKDFTGGLTATSPDSSAAGTEVVTAEWVRANKKQGSDDDYVASLTASDDFFRRPSLFESDKRSVTMPAKIEVKINGTIYKTTETHTISISDFGTQAGKDFYIYACVPAEEDSTEPDFVISQNSTVPTGYTAENSRKIGGFHTLCASVGTLKNVDPLIKSSTSVAHKLSGYVTGDILPASRWDLWHRPKVSPEGYVYCGPDNGCDVWVSIYLLSWDGSKLVSKYNAVTADGSSSKVWHGELFSDAMQAIGGRLPYRREFARFAFGSNEATSIYGSADKTYTGGHTDTSSRRMISDIGCEDCCGYLWQWSEELGFCGGSGWSASTYNSSVDPISRGNAYGGLYRLALGGAWIDGSSCGSRSAACDGVSSGVSASRGGRGLSEPMHRDALTVTGYPV